MAKQSIKHTSGFSIIEVVVAIVIVSISLITISGVIRMTNRTADEVGYTSVVSTIAQDQIESYRNMKYDNIPLGTTDLSSKLPKHLPKPCHANAVISEVSDGLKKVRIDISYGTTTNSYVSLMRGHASD